MCYYFHEMINIDDFNPKYRKVDKMSYKDILIYYTGHDTSDGVKSFLCYF